MRRRLSLVSSVIGIGLILSLVTATALSLGKTTDKVGQLAFFVTGTANAHREVLKMQAASHDHHGDALATIKRHRAFAEQQMRLSLPGLTRRSDPNAGVRPMLAALAVVDELIAANEGAAPTPELRKALSALEISMKHIYDIEEARYFDVNAAALRSRQTSERILMVLAAAITVFGGALLVGLRRAARANLRQKAAELAEALAALEIAQSDRGRLLEETVRATERERVRLAAELHDGPIQALAALCLRLDRAQRKLAREGVEAATPLVSSVRDDLGDEVAALRRVMSELRPPALDEDGLAGATRDYITAFSARTGCESVIRVDLANGVLSEEREVVLYRLVQEALTNVQRHSGATRVRVQLREVYGEAELRVRDNGAGFDTSKSAELVRNGHYGLAGMRERVEAAGGHFAVSSSPGAGVEIVAQLPIAIDDITPALATVG